MKKSLKRSLATLLAIPIALSMGAAASASEFPGIPEEPELVEAIEAPEAPEIINPMEASEPVETAEAPEELPPIEEQGVLMTLLGFPALIFFEGTFLGRFIVEYNHLGTPFGKLCKWIWMIVFVLMQPFMISRDLEYQAARVIAWPLTVIFYPVGLFLSLIGAW